MLVLKIISGIVFAFSLVFHFGTLLNVIVFSDNLFSVLKWFWAVLVFLSWPASEKIRQLVGKDHFGKVFKEAIPEWLNPPLVLTVLYGVGMFLFSLGGSLSIATETHNTEVMLDKLHNGFTALIMAGYAFIFLQFYVYKRIEDDFLKGNANGTSFKNLKNSLNE